MIVDSAPAIKRQRFTAVDPMELESAKVFISISFLCSCFNKDYLLLSYGTGSNELLVCTLYPLFLCVIRGANWNIQISTTVVSMVDS